jgi:hypothetical protein
MAIQKMEQKLGIDIAHGLPEMPTTLNDKLSYLMSLERRLWELAKYPLFLPRTI